MTLSAQTGFFHGNGPTPSDGVDLQAAVASAQTALASIGASVTQAAASAAAAVAGQAAINAAASGAVSTISAASATAAASVASSVTSATGAATAAATSATAAASSASAAATSAASINPANFLPIAGGSLTGALTTKYVNAGIMSYDGSGNYVSDGGGVFLGGTTGIKLRQEGFAANFEEASWAAYPMVANRWCGLSIAPSGSPWNLPTGNVTSLALQLQNGASEERLTISAKWTGGSGGAGEYRIAPYKNGTGAFWPLTVANGDARLQYFNVNKSVTFTNETFGGASGGNTIVNVANPATTGSFRLLARSTDGLVGFERLTSGTADWMMQYRANGEWLVGTQPARIWNDPSQAVDNRHWIMDSSGAQFRLMASNDAVNSFGSALSITRSGATIGTVTIGGAIKLSAVPANFANDAAAATGGIPVGGVYRTGSALMVRVS